MRKLCGSEICQLLTYLFCTRHTLLLRAHHVPNGSRHTPEVTQTPTWRRLRAGRPWQGSWCWSRRPAASICPNTGSPQMSTNHVIIQAEMTSDAPTKMRKNTLKSNIGMCAWPTIHKRFSPNIVCVVTLSYFPHFTGPSVTSDGPTNGLSIH